MSYLANGNDFRDPTIFDRRDSALQRTDLNKKIINNRIVLDELPERFHAITITNFYEIFEDRLPDINEFKCDYANKILVFNSLREGNIIPTISYWGLGNILISADTIYIHNDNPNILETLQDEINNIQSGLNANASLNAADKNEVIQNISTDINKETWTNYTQSTSKVTTTNGSATVTLSSGTWLSDIVGKQIKFNIDGTKYTVLTRNSNTQITLSTNFTGTTGIYDYVILGKSIVKEEMLQLDIRGTTQIMTLNPDETIQKVEHKNASNAILRTDVYTYVGNTITEVRTLSTGDTITYIYNMVTNQVQVI